MVLLLLMLRGALCYGNTLACVLHLSKRSRAYHELSHRSLVLLETRA